MKLHLIVAREWYDKIACGKKLIEYRKVGDYWRKRIWDRRGEITHVFFHRGYTDRILMKRVMLIDIGPCPYEGFDGDFYRLWLEEVFE